MLRRLLFITGRAEYRITAVVLSKGMDLLIGDVLSVWFELAVCIILFLMSVYVLSSNEIKQLHKLFVLFHLVTLLWPFGQYSIYMTDDLENQWAYLNVSFIGIIMYSYLWLIISFLFSQNAKGTSKVFMKLALIPPLVIGAGISLNPVFGWFAQPVDGSYVIREYGPLFWALISMTFIYIAIGCMLLWSTMRKRGGTMRKQSILLLSGQVLFLLLSGTDIVFNVLGIGFDNIYHGFTSAGIMASFICFAVSVQKYSTYKIVTIAQDNAIDSMESGLIVLSDQNVVIHMNQSAKTFIPVKIGQTFPIDRCLECMDPQDSEEFLYVYTHKAKATIQAELVSFSPTIEHVLMRIQPITDRRQSFIGRMVTFQDITEWRNMVEELNNKNRDLSIRNQELTNIQEELFRANKKLELMATTDSLTGCYNRRYLLQMMEYQINFDRRYNIPYSIILLDIDYFKQTNDTYGHQIGDTVLKVTADVLSSRLRQTDILSRYGGEEFLIFLPHTQREYALKLAEELRVLVETNSIQTNQGIIGITISIGVASSEDLDHKKFDDVKSLIVELIAIADEALYRAKNQGRNRIAAAGT